jgi:hypothetical protein
MYAECSHCTTDAIILSCPVPQQELQHADSDYAVDAGASSNQTIAPGTGGITHTGHAAIVEGPDIVAAVGSAGA